MHSASGGNLREILGQLPAFHKCENCGLNKKKWYVNFSVGVGVVILESAFGKLKVL